jgi:hypothetical protein
VVLVLFGVGGVLGALLTILSFAGARKKTPAHIVELERQVREARADAAERLPPQRTRIAPSDPGPPALAEEGDEAPVAQASEAARS